MKYSLKLYSKIVMRLVQLLLHFNYFIFLSKTTSYSLLAKFFEKITPVETPRPLIRLGNNFDGGYLIPDDLNNINKCFSLGIGGDISFEHDLSKRGISSYMADGTIDNLPMQSKYFFFTKKNISNSINDININDFIKSGIKKSSEDFILKIDIEGAEYKNLMYLDSKLLNQVRILVIEFHYLQRILSNLYFDNIINPIFEKILKTHSVVHIHAHNDSTVLYYKNKKIFKFLEISFLRNDRFFEIKKKSKYLDKLDKPNNPEKKELIIPENYFKW